jgi:hypothetical protein
MDEIPTDRSIVLKPTSIAELARLLTRHGIDLALWAYPAANTVDDLLRELERGEARLLEAPFRRELTIVRMMVRRGSQVLIEAEVIENPGRRQRRNRLPSEKLMPGESPAEATKRGLCEELSCPAHAIQVLRCDPPSLTTRKSAPSYPGLRSDYLIHDVECAVAGLPDGPFETHEDYREAGKMITHRWEWRDDGSFDRDTN